MNKKGYNTQEESAAVRAGVEGEGGEKVTVRRAQLGKLVQIFAI